MPDSKPLRLSWTRLRVHSECPAKGGLIAAGQKSPVADIRMYFPGTVADRCMRQWLSQDDPQPGWMAANVASIMDAEEAKARDGDGVVRWRNASDRAEVRQTCVMATYRLETDLQALLGLRSASPHGWDPASRFEVPVQVPHPAGHAEKVLLVGETDLLVRTPTGIQVWDLKLTRDGQYWRKTIGQLVFYEIAVWAMTRSWPERSGLLQPLCDETMPSWEFTMDQRTQMLARIAATCGDIWAGRLDPKPEASRCSYCEVKHACPVKGVRRGRVSPVTGA